MALHKPSKTTVFQNVPRALVTSVSWRSFKRNHPIKNRSESRNNVQTQRHRRAEQRGSRWKQGAEQIVPWAAEPGKSEKGPCTYTVGYIFRRGRACLRSKWVDELNSMPNEPSCKKFVLEVFVDAISNRLVDRLPGRVRKLVSSFSSSVTECCCNWIDQILEPHS